MLRQCFNKGWKVGKKAGFGPLSAFTEKPADVTLPHDAMIMTDRRADYATAGGSAYFKPDNVEYTKTFFVPEANKGKSMYMEFEGVYMNASVWVNGGFAGKHPYGYSNFYVQINDFIKYGADNIVKVVVKNASQPNARWYSGAGIYRNVKLMTGDALHIKVDGVMISTPSVRDGMAVVSVATEVENANIGFKTGWVKTELKDADGNVAAFEKSKFSIFSGESINVRHRIYLRNPNLWDVDNPYLYTCVTTLESDGGIVDEDVNTFGVRSLDLDPDNGVQINGKTVNLKGGCIHHDNGILGSATFEDAEYRRARFHKDMGYNALRMAHHPMSKAMLNACDRLGILVMDELSDVWNTTKCDFDYGLSFADWWEQDLGLMVKKDFNHPCVVMYSVGNEIPEFGSDTDATWGRKIAEKFRSLDGTRFITGGLNIMLAAGGNLDKVLGLLGAKQQDGDINQAMNNLFEKMKPILESPEMYDMIVETNGIFDIVGYNYATDRHISEQDISKNRMVVGAETRIAALDGNWDIIKNNGFVIGDFAWTSWDYLGECGLGHVGYDDDKKSGFYGDYPWIAAYCADFDITGARRTSSYWREIIWGGRKGVPYIAVLPPNRFGQTQYPTIWSWTDTVSSWTWPGAEGGNISVEIYSDAEEIELFINGDSKGRKPVGGDSKLFYCRFDTVYEAGCIEAVAYMDGAETGRCRLQTAGVPALKVTRESDEIRAGTNDLCYINVELIDDNGVLNAFDNRDVKFNLEGAGILQASGSADPRTVEYYYDNTHRTFYGRALAIIRAGEDKGTAKLTISSDGMESVSVEVQVV